MATTKQFDYTVRDRSGKVIKGKLESDSRTAVATKLRSMGYLPVAIEPVKNQGFSKEINLPKIGPKVKAKDLAVFSRQFATMINAGLSLLKALSVLESQTDNKELRKVLAVIRGDVEGGVALSTAMAKHQDVFAPLYINLVRAGEVGGFLDQAMLRIAENLEADVKLRGQVKSAMAYPVIVFVLAIVMTIAMLIFVVPTFANMFTSLGSRLPAPTRFLVWLSDVMKWAIFPSIVMTIAGFGIWTRIRHKEAIRNKVDPFKLKLPIFGKLFAKIALSRFSRNLSTLLGSGVPILQSLDIVKSASGNSVIAHAIDDVQKNVRQGQSLSAPLSNHSVFPGMVVQMMAVGEDAGALDSMLIKISEFYDQEVEATTAALTSLLEPLMIVFLGAIIGGMIVAMYLPIFKLYDAIGG